MKLSILLLLSVFILIAGCTTPKETANEKLKLSAQIGLNKGGVTENTDMNAIPGLEENPAGTVDACTGATKTGFNAGVHANYPLKRNEVETGIDMMYNNQVFTYNDEVHHFNGQRTLHVTQLMIPATYNFNVLKNAMPAAQLQVKIGVVGQINFIDASNSGQLPDYTINRWTNGFTFGFSAYPFHFNNNHLGFYVDGYRGTQVYQDFYNLTEFEMPGSSYMKFGIRYQFK